MSDLWYYRNSGRQFGPMTLSALNEVAANGGIGTEDEVRTGHGQWQPASDVVDLSEQVGSRSASSMMDPFQDILGEAPTADASDLPHEEPAQTVAYYCRLQGEQAGPFSIDELQRLVNEGRLEKHDRVLLDGSRCWLPCSELPELDFSTAIVNPEASDDADDFDEDDEPYDEDDLIDDDDDGFEFVSTTAEINEPAQPGDSEIPSWTGHHAGTGREPVSTAATAAVSQFESPSAQPFPVPTRPPTPPSPRKQKYRQEKSSSSSPREFALPPVQYLLGGLGVVALVVAAVFLWPTGSGQVQGQVSIDGAPVPIGIVSITPQKGSKGPSLSMAIIDGRFEARDDMKLIDGTYKVSVTVGNPLKMPVPQLKGTPFESLNGARFQTLLDTKSLKTPSIDLEFAATEVVKPKKKRRRK